MRCQTKSCLYAKVDVLILKFSPSVTVNRIANRPNTPELVALTGTGSKDDAENEQEGLLLSC